MKLKKWMRIVCIALALIMISAIVIGALPIFAVSEESSQAESSQVVDSSEGESGEQQADGESVKVPLYDPSEFLPKDMRAVVVSPTVDFYLEQGQSIDTTQAQIKDLVTNATNLHMNTLIVNTVVDGDGYYNTDTNKTVEEDMLCVLVKMAREYGLNVYFVFDIHHVFADASDSLSGMNMTDYIIAQAHRFAIKYNVDGILLDGYYADTSMPRYNTYMKNGGGIGFENWLMENGAYTFKTVCDVIHKTSNTFAVGLYVENAWANSATTEGGSATKDSFEALKDGYADTKGYVEQGLADFILVHAKGSLTDSNLPFDKVVDWWGDLAKQSDTALYVLHENSKICTSEKGWLGEDQVIKQILHAKKQDKYQGSAFASIKSLKADKKGSTTALIKYFNDDFNEDAIYEDLKLTSPTKLTFTTLEPAVKFQGTFDENFDVYLNGEKIILNEAGYFYFNIDLKVGLNTFTISHKDKVYTYKITRRVEVLKDGSVTPSDNMKVDGETSIGLSVIAYRGSSVSATINGKTIGLEPTQGQVDGIDPNSNYTLYTGSYTVPKSIVGEEQALGTVSFYGEYMGFYKTLYGGTITVAEKVIPHSNGSAVFVDASSVGTGEVIATLEPTISNGTQANMLKITKDFTRAFDAKTIGSYLSPVYSSMPLNTVEYLKGESGGYYVTTSGRLIEKANAEVFAGDAIGHNKLDVLEIGARGGETIFKIKLDKKVALNIQPSPVTFYSKSGDDYYVSSFNATEVHVVFENITQVTKLPGFENSYLFSAGKWDTIVENGLTKFRLVLTLRNSGVYNGCSSYYDNEDNLILEFTKYAQTLAGTTVVIDPGHGYTGEKYDPGAIGHIREVDANLALAKLVEEKLKAQGATVVRYNVESEHYTTANRATFARQYNPDIYISIHCNAAYNSSARGTEVYYFTPFSQPLAQGISAYLASYWENNVYMDGVNRNRGDKYASFMVTHQHDFASVLIETGFVTNKDEAMALANPAHQDGLANAIVAGIKKYLERSPYVF